MKLGTADFPKLQFSLLLAVLMIAIGAGAVYFSLNGSKSAKLRLMAAQNEQSDFAGKLFQRVRSEENEIKQKSAIFNDLRSRGVIGDEQRLEWVELLKEVRDQRKLIDLKYEIAPQRSLDAKQIDGYNFFSSEMELATQASA